MKHKKKITGSDKLPMSLHLKELKQRCLIIIVFFLVLFITIYTKTDDILKLIISLGEDAGFSLVYISPQEVFIQELAINAIIAIIGSLPILIYEIYMFIAPAFDNKKNIGIKLLIIFFIGFLLFLGGAVFSIFIILPSICKTLFSVGVAINATSMITIANFVSFCVFFIICLGIIFEIPLISVILALMNILKGSFMKKTFRYAIVVIFIIAALITPPDVISQIAVALPIIALYSISIWLCTFIEKRKIKNKASD